MNNPHRRRLLRIAGWTLAVVVIGALGYYLLEYLPQQAAIQIHGDPYKRLEAFNASRATGAQIFLGLGIFASLVLTYRRMRAVESQAATAVRQAKAAEDGQITERFTRAIEQLGTTGAEKMAIRLGGIYALERILRDSEADAPTVQEVLAAFVRDELNRRRAKPQVQAETVDSNDGAGLFVIHTDLKAALTVLSRSRLPGQNPDVRELCLTHCDLRGLQLSGLNLLAADLNGAYLTAADLNGAILAYAHLTGANLNGARLTGANLIGANLTDAHLTGAHLNGAHLTGAILTHAHFIGAHLNGAHLNDADLYGAILTGAHLNGAILNGAHLNGADLNGADLNGANLTGADLTGAHLNGADLTDADLTKADLTKADLTRATLNGATLNGAHLPDDNLPSSFSDPAPSPDGG